VAVLRAEECRERALECARKSAEATEPALRSMFAELAEQWTRMAQYLELRAGQNRLRVF
jgi:hypothetical protein